MVGQTYLSITGLLFVGFSLWGDAAQAANTYYVATSGKDTNSCAQARTSSAAKLTISDAVGCLTAGDTLYVRAGNYDETLIYAVPSGSSWSNKVRIAAYPGETVWMRPTDGVLTSVLWFGRSQQYIEFDGINLDASKLKDSNIVTISNGDPNNYAHHIRIQNAELIGAQSVHPDAKTQGILTGGTQGGHEFINLTIHDVGRNDFEHAIYIGESNVLVEGCNIYNIAGAGVHLYNGYGPTFSNVVVRNNTIHDSLNTGTGQRHVGIVVANGSLGSQVYNNLIYNILANGGYGVGVSVYVADDTGIYNNTVYGNSQGILLSQYAARTVVRNNVAFRNNGDYENSGSGTAASNNLFGIDPKFMNASGRDFRLQQGSPAIDTGTTISVVNADLTGLQRPQGGASDIGAFEWSPAPTTVPPPPTGLHIIQ
jgi:parallel beta-helix repeat protein